MLKCLWCLRVSSFLAAVWTGYYLEGFLVQGVYLCSRTVWLVRLYALAQVVMLEASPLAQGLGSDQERVHVGVQVWMVIWCFRCP